MTISVEWMMEFENYHSAVIKVTIFSQETSIDTKTNGYKYLVITQGKVFQGETARHPFNQVIKANHRIMKKITYCLIGCTEMNTASLL